MITGIVQTARGQFYDTKIDIYHYASLVSLFDNVVCIWKVRLKK